MSWWIHGALSRALLAVTLVWHPVCILSASCLQSAKLQNQKAYCKFGTTPDMMAKSDLKNMKSTYNLYISHLGWIALLFAMDILHWTIWSFCLCKSKMFEYWQFHNVQPNTNYLSLMYWPRPLSYICDFAKICKLLNSQVSSPKISELGQRTWVTITVIIIATITLFPGVGCNGTQIDALHVSQGSHEWG